MKEHDRNAEQKHSAISMKEARKFRREAARVLKYRGSRLDGESRGRCSGAIGTLGKALDSAPAGTTEATDAVREAVNAVRTAFKPHEAVLAKASVREYVESMGIAIFVALLVRSFVFEAFQIPTGSMIPTLRISDHLFVNKFVYGLRIPFTHYDVISGTTPKRGEIVVFDFPGPGEDHGKAFIKRVVGLPGDRVKLENNQLFINGKPVPSKTLDASSGCEDATLAACSCQRQLETLDGVQFVTQHVVETPGNRSPACRNSPAWPVNNPMTFGSPVENPDFPEIRVPAGHVFCMGDNRDNSSDGRYWGFVPIDFIRGRASIFWWPPDRLFKPVE